MAGQYDYLDPIGSTRKYLKAWPILERTVKSGDARLAELDAKMTAFGSQSDGPRVSGGGENGQENRLIMLIDAKEKIEAKINDAKEKLIVLNSAYEELQFEDRAVLHYAFHDENASASKVAEELHISRSEAYRQINTAVNHLSHILYW